METIVLNVRPARGPKLWGLWETYLDGELIIKPQAETVRPAARFLMDCGYDPETLLTVQVDGASEPSFPPRTLKAWGHEYFRETDRGMWVEKWRPNRLGVRSSWYDPDYWNNRSRIDDSVGRQGGSGVGRVANVRRHGSPVERIL